MSQTPTRFDFQRAALQELDPRDTNRVRGWLLDRTDNLVTMRGRAPDELIFFSSTHLEATATTGHRDPHLASLLRTFGDGEVIRRFRTGNLPGRAVVVEWSGGDRWWVAMRRYGVSEGVGIWLDEWKVAEGSGLETAPGDIKAWLDASQVELLGMDQGEARLQPEDIRMGTVEATGELPDDPLAVGHILGEMHDVELLSTPFDYTIVFVFRPGLLERWEVRRLHAPFDDFVRAIVSKGQVDAVSVVQGAVIEMPDGTRKKCLLTTTERLGTVGQRALPYEVRGTEIHTLEAVFRSLGARRQWIGVPPQSNVQLEATGES